MIIKHTLSISGSPDLVARFEVDELEVIVYARVTSWDSDDHGRPVIEDLEIDMVEVYDDGELVAFDDDLHNQLLELLDKDHLLTMKVCEEAEEEGEAYILERNVQRVASAREARRGN